MKKTSSPQPPKLLYSILRFLIRNDMRLFVLGDFDEEYLDAVDNMGHRRANIWYWKHFFYSLPKIMKDTVVWKMEMFKNYLVIAMRGMKRQKVLALINILGLSLAMMICLWIFLFVKDEFSFDRFHKNRDSIYSVIKNDYYFDIKRRYIEVIAGPAMMEYFPEIEYFSRFSSTNVIVESAESIYQERCHFVDKDFFKMFSFGLTGGDADHALQSENTVILTERMVKKYFGRQDPVGKILTITLGQNRKDFFVSAVAADVPANSFLQFDMLMNIKELYSIYGPPDFDNRNWTLAYTFIQLKAGTDPEAIEARLPAFYEQYFGPIIEDRKKRGSWKKQGETVSLWLQNYQDIYFHSQGIEGHGESHLAKSYILTGIGFLILFIAVINFTNLSIGRASTRTTEIGIRKVLGAERKNLRRQFRGEAIITVFLSLAVGLLTGLLLLPLFNRLAAKQISEAEALTFPNLLIFVGMAILIGTAAGWYPGAVLSQIQPVNFFNSGLKLGRKSLLTRSLIVIQFSLSVFLIAATFIIAKQLRYILNKDVGYHRKGIVVINTFERRNPQVSAQIFDLFEAETEKLPFIYSVSGCTFPLSAEIGLGRIELNGRNLPFNFTSVYYNFCETMGIKMLAGRDFPRPFPDDYMPLIVSQSFVDDFELKDPIGSVPETDWRIIGVVEDFQFFDFREKMKPNIITFSEEGPRNLLVKVDPSRMKQAVSSLAAIWKKAYPHKPFDYSFEDEIFASKYSEEKRWSGIVFYSSFLAVLITCMGLIGITTLSTSRRVKEIGIRKTLGASVSKICRLISGEYLALVCVSNLISWPLSFYFMNKWLSGYAYRTDIDIGIFLSAGFISFLVSVMTIGSFVYRAASANPVESLRYE